MDERTVSSGVSLPQRKQLLVEASKEIGIKIDKVGGFIPILVLEVSTEGSNSVTWSVTQAPTEKQRTMYKSVNLW